MFNGMTVISQVWSLGVLLWVMVYGANPFNNVVAAEECILKFPQEGVISEVSSSLKDRVGLWLDHIHTLATWRGTSLPCLPGGKGRSRQDRKDRLVYTFPFLQDLAE